MTCTSKMKPFSASSFQFIISDSEISSGLTHSKAPTGKCCDMAQPIKQNHTLNIIYINHNNNNNNKTYHKDYLHPSIGYVCFPLPNCSWRSLEHWPSSIDEKSLIHHLEFHAQ